MLPTLEKKLNQNKQYNWTLHKFKSCPQFNKNFGFIHSKPITDICGVAETQCKDCHVSLKTLQLQAWPLSIPHTELA